MTEDIKQVKRLSKVTDIILFLVFVCLTVLLLKYFGITDSLEITKILELENTSDNTDDNNTIKNENIQLINKIKKEYGITVLYGSGTEKYTNKVDATVQKNDSIINNNLSQIYKALNKYPLSIFDQFKNKTYPMYIILVDQFKNNNLALASKSSLNEVRIYISNTQKFERAFHHEFYHVLEYSMSDKDSTIYQSWNDLNPRGFKYQEDISKLNTDFVYIKDSNNKEAINDDYFVTKYAKTTEKEDRAETFAELMTMTSLNEYFSNGKNIRKKADYILSELKKNFTIDGLYCTVFF